MNIHTLPATETKNLTALTKLLIWLKAIDDGFNSDPREQLYQSHKRISQEVERLRARVRKLET